MRVNERAVAAIVLGLVGELAENTASAVSSRMLLRRWQCVGLREADLEAALTALRQSRDLAATGQAEAVPGYQLTEQGMRRLRFLHSPLWLGLAAHQRLQRKAARRLKRRQGKQLAT